MATRIINVTLKTEGPLSISLPVAEYTQPNKWHNAPVMTLGLNSEGEPRETAFIPATTIRGMLRRNVALPVMEKRAADGNPSTLHQAYADLIGQDAGSEKQPDEIDPIAIRKLRQENPIVDLFGSGLGVKSRLKVSHFMAEHHVLPSVFTGVRKDLGDNDDGAVLDLLSSKDREEYLARTNANSKRAQADALLQNLIRKKRQGKDGPDIEAEIEAATSKVEAYEAIMGDMKNSSRTLLSYFALPAGVEWTGRLIIDRATPADIDALEGAFDRFSNYPMLGGQQARGCGELSGKAEIRKGNSLEKIISFGGFTPARIDSLIQVV
tara:strand:- start:106 stop:1074 length:969 start_codon:yes stop_codon:yes gene_type:complete